MPRSRSSSRLRDALAPVRDALLAAARAEADQILARADQTAGELLRQAQAQADEIRAQAAAQAAGDAAELIAVQRVQAGRQARAMVLAAERDEYEALREAARRAVARLRDEPGYPHVRHRMTEVLRRLLGDEAQVHEAADGGVIARAAGRSADLSFVRLADRAIDRVLAEESSADSAAPVAVGR